MRSESHERALGTGATVGQATTNYQHVYANRRHLGNVDVTDEENPVNGKVWRWEADVAAHVAQEVRDYIRDHGGMPGEPGIYAWCAKSPGTWEDSAVIAHTPCYLGQTGMAARPLAQCRCGGFCLDECLWRVGGKPCGEKECSTRDCSYPGVSFRGCSAEEIADIRKALRGIDEHLGCACEGGASCYWLRTRSISPLPTTTSPS